MKSVFWYKISIIGLITVLFSLSYLLGSFVYGEDEPVSENEISVVSEGEIQGPDRYEGVAVTQDYYNIPLSKCEQEFVSSCCRAYSIPEKFAYAVMSVESDYNTKAIAGCDYGIMQINVINHECMKQALQIDDFLDFYDNVKCGIYLLGQYYYRFNDFNMAAMCYHYGRTGAGEYWKKGIYSTAYTDAVNKAMSTINIDNSRFE